MKFNNRKNEPVILQDDREIWLSRACAVVAEVCMYVEEDSCWYILLGQRGPATPDYQGYWCLPCGYLDWDENLTEAMIREVWEECGLYLPGLSEQHNFVYSNNNCILHPQTPEETPWCIADKPTTNKQNVTFHYAICFRWKGAPLPAISNAYCEPDEVSDLAWVKLHDATDMNLAFDHAKRIEMLWREKPALFSEIEKYA